MEAIQAIGVIVGFGLAVGLAMVIVMIIIGYRKNK